METKKQILLMSVMTVDLDVSTFVPGTSLQDDRRSIASYLNKNPGSCLIGVGKGGYLLFNVLLDSELAKQANKVVILSAPFSIKTWEKRKLLQPEEAAYYQGEPADSFYTDLPPILLLYGKSDHIVPHDQGRLALAGLRRSIEPGAKRPNVQLIILPDQRHDLLKDKETVKNIIEWLSL